MTQLQAGSPISLVYKLPLVKFLVILLATAVALPNYNQIRECQSGRDCAPTKCCVIGINK